MTRSPRKKPRDRPRGSKSKPRGRPRKVSKPRGSKSKPRGRPRVSKSKPRGSKRKTTSRGVSIQGGDDRTKVINWLKNNELFKSLYIYLKLPPMRKFEDTYDEWKSRTKNKTAKHAAKQFAIKMKTKLNNALNPKGSTKVLNVKNILTCLLVYMISIALYVLAGLTGRTIEIDVKKLLNDNAELAQEIDNLANEFMPKALNSTTKNIEKLKLFINRKYPKGWPIFPKTSGIRLDGGGIVDILQGASALALS